MASHPPELVTLALAVALAWSGSSMTEAADVAATKGAPGPFADAAVSPVHYVRTPAAAVTQCAALTSLTDAGLTVISAAEIAATATAPEHCRISAHIAPAIALEIDLPVRWNQRFYMMGNGGAAGESADDPRRVEIRDRALRQGFLTASTNAGHDARIEPEYTFAMDPQKLADYGYRAVHLTAEAANQAAIAFYAQRVRYSYWDGCSTGGREGLMEAQRFPGDFDGLVIGAPALDFTNLLVRHVWTERILEQTPLTAAKLQFVGKALYDKCDARDGLEDGLIEDPRRCDFDPGRDVKNCPTDRSDDSCLTANEVAALRKLYAGPVVQGRPVFPGTVLGAEPAVPGGAQSGWGIDAHGAVRGVAAVASSQLRYAVMRDEHYDWHDFDLDRDLPRLDVLRQTVDATNPDLSALRRRGGKILMYYGWADTVLSPQMGVNYYEVSQKVNGPGTDGFFRLFMVPGMFHCSGGYGPDKFDAVTAIINWVERGKAPASMMASQVSQGNVVRSRVLCPYPRTAHYNGNGSVDQASSFACKRPPGLVVTRH